MFIHYGTRKVAAASCSFISMFVRSYYFLIIDIGEQLAGEGRTSSVWKF